MSVSIRSMGEWSEGGRRWALAVLVGCVALLVAATPALAVGTGTISGKVTAAVSHEALKNVEVTVYEDSEHGQVDFATTGSGGEYTVNNLPAGKYKVEFSGGFESGQNFVTQFYKAKSSFEKADPVEVVIAEPAKSENVNAEMEVGGKIEGTVTNTVTHKALANVAVAAIGTGAEGGYSFALTEANGHYTIVGLATGSYRVEFGKSGYVNQYYDDQSSPASANLVEVVQEKTTWGINAALMPKAPINTVAPVASGALEVGQTLGCTSGSWTGAPKPTFTYSWLRDGVAIPGANASVYGVQAVDVGNGLTCKVTATNESGSVAAVSNTLIVPVPAPPPLPTPIVELAGSKLVVLGSSARVPIACAGATCTGTIELSGQIVVKHRKGRRTISKKQTVVLAKGLYSLAAGNSATIVVRLTAAGKSALAHAKNHKLSAKGVVTVTGGPTVRSSLVLSEAPPAKHRPKPKHR
jgi:Carboxypeptidase regulatory-like domain